MDLNIWLAFVAASAALIAIPGPTILLVLSYALSRGRQVAVATALGVAVGDFIAMTASLAGVGTLVLASATLFSILKWVGAAYLIWMGIKLWRSAPTGGLSVLEGEGSTKTRSVFGHAALVTALNPKSIAFFIAFVPQFIRPNEALLSQFSILIATYVALGALSALLYALLAGHMRDWIAKPAAIRALTRTGGAALIGMGLFTALLRRPAA